MDNNTDGLLSKLEFKKNNMNALADTLTLIQSHGTEHTRERDLALLMDESTKVIGRCNRMIENIKMELS